MIRIVLLFGAVYVTAVAIGFVTIAGMEYGEKLYDKYKAPAKS